jgi:hypothetical protein
MAATGLGGCVTTRGWVELHNPASTNISLKLFSSANIGGATSATKRLTLADGDGVINVGENLKEVSDMETFKHAIRSMCRAAQFVMPWNFSFAAIDGFLNSSNYCAADLSGRPDRAPILVDFINYILGLNAAAWQQKEPFHTSGDIKTQWSEWFGSQPAALLKTAAEDNTFQGGKGGREGFQGGKTAFNQGQAAQPLGGGPKRNGANLSAQGGGGLNILVCKRYNNNICPNHYSNCFLANGKKLYHVCDVTNGKGEQCRVAALLNTV